MAIPFWGLIHIDSLSGLTPPSLLPIRGVILGILLLTAILQDCGQVCSTRLSPQIQEEFPLVGPHWSGHNQLE